MGNPGEKQATRDLGSLMRKPPSPIVLGTAVALAVALLVMSPLYGGWIISGVGLSPERCITFQQLFDDYYYDSNGYTSYFRSYDPGDKVYVIDTVNYSHYSSYSKETTLRFDIEHGSITIIVDGDCEDIYSPGTKVIITLEIIGTTSYESIDMHITPSQIRLA
jgi:hypothetical protein